jgi:hypothetical protein
MPVCTTEFNKTHLLCGIEEFRLLTNLNLYQAYHSIFLEDHDISLIGKYLPFINIIQEEESRTGSQKKC